MLSGTLKRISLAALASAGVLAFPVLPSLADITIKAQEAAGMGQTPPVPQTITLFYKGANARLQVSGEPTLIQDGKGNVLYGLDTTRKTYYMTVPTEVEMGVGGPAKEDVKLDLHDTGKTMIFAGTTAHQYIVAGTVDHPKPQGGGGRGRGGRGGRRRGGGGGGGFPGFPLASSNVNAPTTVDQYGGGGEDGSGEGGSGEGRGGQGSGVNPAQWSMTGELWLSDDYKFPSKENTLFAAQLAASSSGPFQQPLADALDKHKGLPLLARITVTYTPASSAGRPINQYGGVVEGAKASTTPTTTVTTFTVQSVSEAPLADTLFQAPLSYTLVAAPLNPYTPGTPVSAQAP
jgi:hypothetical protein